MEGLARNEDVKRHKIETEEWKNKYMNYDKTAGKTDQLLKAQREEAMALKKSLESESKRNEKLEEDVKVLLERIDSQAKSRPKVYG